MYMGVLIFGLDCGFLYSTLVKISSCGNWQGGGRRSNQTKWTHEGYPVPEQMSPVNTHITKFKTNHHANLFFSITYSACLIELLYLSVLSFSVSRA